MITLRVNTSEEREFRLIAVAEGLTTSGAIRSAMRRRAEELAGEARGATMRGGRGADGPKSRAPSPSFVA